VPLVTPNQRHGFSKPRVDFSYEGFEKPFSSGYEYPEEHTKYPAVQHKHVLFLANILGTNNLRNACVNQKVFAQIA